MNRMLGMQSFVALAVVTCATAILLGQDRPPRPAAYSALAYWAPISEMVTQGDILSDLKLTADQLEVVRKAQAEHQQTIAENPLVGGQDFPEQVRKLREAAQTRDEAIRTALGDKARRLEQIAAQSAGLAAFVTRPDLREQLAITDEQLAKGTAILDATYQEMLAAAGTVRVAFVGPGPSGAASRTTFVEKTTPKLLELLTDEQKQRWQDAIGEPVPAATLVQVRTSTRAVFGTPRDGAVFVYGSLIYTVPVSGLVNQADVLSELKLTADQQEAVRKALAEYQQTIPANPLVGGQVFPEQVRKQSEAARKRDEAIRTALGDKARRLDQIAAQSAGLAAFVTRPELRQQLAITEEQMTKGKEILEATYKEVLAVVGTPQVASRGAGGAANRTTFVEKSTPKLLELLTDEQKTRWQEATGEPVAAAILTTVRTITIPSAIARGDDDRTRDDSRTQRGARDAVAPRTWGSNLQLASRASFRQLLAHDEVVRELNLTANQLESIRKAQAEYRQAIAANSLGRGQNLTEVLQKQSEANQTELAAIRAVLGDKSQRLDQINAQAAGLAWFFTGSSNDPAARQPLKITDEQWSKGREILDAAYQEMAQQGELPRPPMLGVQGAEFRTTFVDKTTPKLLELLTDDQKQLWQAATGEPVAAALLVKIRTIDFSEGTGALPPQVAGSRFYPDMSNRLHQEARALERRRDYPAAVQKMREALDIDPDNDVYLAYASQVERLAGNYADGVEHALRAVKIIEKKTGWYYASVAFNPMRKAIARWRAPIAKRSSNSVRRSWGSRISTSPKNCWQNWTTRNNGPESLTGHAVRTRVPNRHGQVEDSVTVAPSVSSRR
ncbi:MAG TPA: hypothetical protein VM165_15215 [Planctomycetaceae bacterium]|nr:hypothetical protein [Planctomycetaceae bacterium]